MHLINVISHIDNDVIIHTGKVHDKFEYKVWIFNSFNAALCQDSAAISMKITKISVFHTLNLLR